MSDGRAIIFAFSVVLVGLVMWGLFAWFAISYERSVCHTMRARLGQDPGYNLTSTELYYLYARAPNDPHCVFHCCHQVMERYIRSEALRWHLTPRDGRLQAIKCRLTQAEHVLAYHALRDELRLGRTLPCDTLRKALPYVSPQAH